MNCESSLRIIDALPFADEAQLANLERHAHDCAQCKAALKTSRDLDIVWRRLPEPAPAMDLTSGIMSRVEQQSPRWIEQRAETAPEVARVASTPSRRKPLAWVALLFGLLISLGAQSYSFLIGESTLDLGSSWLRVGIAGMINMPSASPSLLVLVAGLLLYLVGLFGFQPTHRVKTRS